MTSAATPAAAKARARRPAPPPLANGCALFLDIDGTLIDLAPTPSGVRIDADIAAMLPALARRLDGAVALITGRRIVDVDRLFGGIRLPVAGQHGCERRSADGETHVHAPSPPPALTRLRDEINDFASRHGGLLFEDKGSTLALHYRQVPKLAGHVHRTLRAKIADVAPSEGTFRLQPGKGIVEVKPAGLDKGTAILDYMKEPPFRRRSPVFVGDDATDEYGFAAVTRLGGLSVKVGRGRTAAEYRLRDVAAVREWLRAAL